jgi:hypothetical protein
MAAAVEEEANGLTNLFRLLFKDHARVLVVKKIRIVIGFGVQLKPLNGITFKLTKSDNTNRVMTKPVVLI